MGRIAGSGDGANFPFNRFVPGLKHFLREINRAITCRFRAHERAAPITRLAREHAGKLVGKPFVLTKEITYFAPTDPDIAGRHIGVRTDVPEQLGHKRLAKPHDFVVGFRLRIEIRAAFASAHRQGSERILKNLFKGEKLQDAGVDRRVESEAPFVRPEGAVHLDAKPAIYVDLALVVDPGNAELNQPLRLNKTFKDLAVPILFMPLNRGFDGLENFGDRLKKLRLVRISLFDDLENFLD